MSRQAKLGPAWLIDLLCQWALRSDRDDSKGLGYYRINPMLRDGIPTPARSYEPTGYSDQDFSDVERAINLLEIVPKLAIIRYCKPSKARVIDAEYPRDTGSWLYYLKTGLATLEVSLDRRTVYERARSKAAA